MSMLMGTEFPLFALLLLCVSIDESKTKDNEIVYAHYEANVVIDCVRKNAR